MRAYIYTGVQYRYQSLLSLRSWSQLRHLPHQRLVIQMEMFCGMGCDRLTPDKSSSHVWTEHPPSNYTVIYNSGCRSGRSKKRINLIWDFKTAGLVSPRTGSSNKLNVVWKWPPVCMGGLMIYVVRRTGAAVSNTHISSLTSLQRTQARISGGHFIGQ